MSANEYLPIEDEEASEISLSRLQTPKPPEDKHSLAWFLFVILGTGMLFPWDCFLSTPFAYWTLLFGKFPFLFVMSLTSSTPNTLFLLMSTKFGPRFSFGSRTLIAFMVDFAVLIIVPIAGSVLEKNVALGVILVAVFLQGAATATLFGSVLGLAALFPPRYIGAIMSGNGVAGIITITLTIIIKLSVPNTDAGLELSAMIFFGISALVILICIASYILLTKLDITKFYLQEYQRHNKYAQQRKSYQMRKGLVPSINSSDTEEGSGLLAPPEQQPVSMFGVFKKVWKQAFNVWIVFFVSLALFPGISSKITTQDHLVSDDWFFIFMMALFMIGDYIGRTAPKWIRIPSPKALWVPSVARLVFFPLFILSAKGMVFHYDAFSYIFMFVFALSNGYFGTLAMMYGPDFADNHEKETAGAMMSFFLQAGIFMASAFALLLLYVIFGQAPF